MIDLYILKQKISLYEHMIEERIGYINLNNFQQLQSELLRELIEYVKSMENKK